MKALPVSGKLKIMDKEEIRNLLLRYKQGLCTSEEAARIHQWYEGIQPETAGTLDEQEQALLQERMLAVIQSRMVEEATDRTYERVRWRRMWLPFAAAASVALILGVFWFRQNQAQQVAIEPEVVFLRSEPSKWIHHRNERDSSVNIKLHDGSVVALTPGSEIIYPDQFSGNVRDVQLTGDAFFEITRDPSRPFFVYSGKLVTKVLGTSFRITSYPRDKVTEVEVVTGKVSVFENNKAFEKEEKRDVYAPNNGVVLTPNQRVTYHAASRHLTTGLVAVPVKVASAITTPPVAVFNNASLLEIAKQLENEYGIEIVFGNERLEKCTFTGDITDMPLYDKLALVCRSNQASFEAVGTRILVNGPGCD